MESTLPLLAIIATVQFVGADTDAHATSTLTHIIYVNDDVAIGDGLTWETAFGDLQDALAVAQPSDEIWVATGIYTPSENDATASFVLAPDIAIYGGFNGTEITRDQRDWEVNATILSGDIGRDDVIGQWPSEWLTNSANSGHVIVASGTTPSTIIDGFTISDGSTGPSGTPAGDELMYGSGIYIENGSPTISNCTVEHNLSAFGSGGGLYCWNGDPVIVNCIFRQNYVHGGGGGGMMFYGDCTPIIQRCEIRENISVAIYNSNGNGDGAGIAFNSDNWVTVEDCLFHGNLAKAFYIVGDQLGYGGAIWVWTGGITVSNCVFTNNTAHYGAGLFCCGNGTVINCLFLHNTATVQPNDPYPEQGGSGAAVVAYSASPDLVNIINCTIAYNNGKKYVGAFGTWSAQVNLINTIVRDNTGTHPEVINTWKEQAGGFNDVLSCNIEHIFEPHGEGEDPIDPEDLPGCIDADPLWINPGPYGDLRLGPGSPCIDAANNTLVPPGITIDLDGNPRFMDDPATADTGVGPAPIVDMGAFEFGDSGVLGDVTGDGLVNIADLLELIEAWGPCSGCPSDLNGDGFTDVSDILIVIGNWGP